MSDLGLDADEHITGVRFEYGRVEVGGTTRPDGQDRELLKDPHDDLGQIGGTNPQALRDQAPTPSPSPAAWSLSERHLSPPAR